MLAVRGALFISPIENQGSQIRCFSYCHITNILKG